MKICVFVCNNGLGHIRRVVAISSFILKNKKNVYIDAFLSLESLKLMKSWPESIFFKNHPKVKIINFTYPKIFKKHTSDPSINDWLSIQVPNLEIYDIVWSDNILDILEYRPDTKITGSFLWHETMNNFKSMQILKFIERQKDLLKKHRPKMAGVEYFSTKTVKQKTDFYPVGLYKYSSIIGKKKGRNILMSCGLAGEEERITKSTIEFIIDNNLEPPQTLFVEPRLLPRKYPKWIKKASFSAEMFNSCIAACIRPGIGTISDSLVNHLKIFAFSTFLSHEMLHNCKILEKLKLGVKCLDPLSAYFDAISYAKSEKKIEAQILKTSHLRTDGVFATSNFILGKNY